MSRLVLIGLLLSILTVADIAAAQDGATDRMTGIRELVAQRDRGEVMSQGMTKKQGQSDGFGVKLIEGLLVCGVVLCGGVWWLKRKNGNGGHSHRGRRMRIVEKLPVGQKTHLILANVDGREILLSCGGEKVTFCSLSEHSFLPEQELEVLCGTEEDRQRSVA